ncbi:hypothetical protein V6N13_014670 [Hibiscus sabdariffa]|uniref:Uncharacterized protein n=1 Tax=Hibiscus sabdariffa TaxID=183260 RepID=A0ABR2RW13_9ROSI
MEKQEVERLDAPMILAVKVHLKSARNIVAYELAEHLKYPLIDQDEITPFLQNSQHLDDMSFDIAKYMSSYASEQHNCLIYQCDIYEQLHSLCNINCQYS